MTVVTIRAGTAVAILVAGAFASFPSVAAPCIHYVRQDTQVVRPAATIGACENRAATVRVGEAPAWNSTHVVRRALQVEPAALLPADVSDAAVDDRLALRQGMPVEAPAAFNGAALPEARPIPDDRKDVRVVGWKFRPDADEEMEFQRIARGEGDPVVSTMHEAAALFGVVAARIGGGSATESVATAEPVSSDTQAVAGLD